MRDQQDMIQQLQKAEEEKKRYQQQHATNSNVPAYPGGVGADAVDAKLKELEAETRKKLEKEKSEKAEDAALAMQHAKGQYEHAGRSTSASLYNNDLLSYLVAMILIDPVKQEHYLKLFEAACREKLLAEQEKIALEKASTFSASKPTENPEHKAEPVLASPKGSEKVVIQEAKLEPQPAVVPPAAHSQVAANSVAADAGQQQQQQRQEQQQQAGHRQAVDITATKGFTTPK